MSINTSEGNSRYLKIIKPFAEEVLGFGEEYQKDIIINESFFMRDNLYAVAERYGAGSIFPMASEKIIEIVNEAFDGELKVESKAAQDISDGTDVKTAFVQTYKNSNYSSITGLKGKTAGIRAIIIHDYSDKVKFKYLVIPSECIVTESGDRQDSISINYDSEGEISLDSIYWSTQCSFYDFCMLPESAFIHNFNKNEEIRKSKLTQRRNRTFKEVKQYIIDNQVSMNYIFKNKLVENACGFYNTKDCVNEYKNFTEEQCSELADLSTYVLAERTRKEKQKKYEDLIYILDDKKSTSIRELMEVYFNDIEKAKNCSWLSKNEYGNYYFSDEQTESLKSTIIKNKLEEKKTAFDELIRLIYSRYITSITQLEKIKYPASRLRKNYDNDSFYFDEVIPDWKEKIENAFNLNKKYKLNYEKS